MIENPCIIDLQSLVRNLKVLTYSMLCFLNHSILVELYETIAWFTKLEIYFPDLLNLTL